jgi:UDP-N-acetylglucosamine 2-epimerase
MFHNFFEKNFFRPWGHLSKINIFLKKNTLRNIARHFKNWVVLAKKHQPNNLGPKRLQTLFLKTRKNLQQSYEATFFVFRLNKNNKIKKEAKFQYFLKKKLNFNNFLLIPGSFSYFFLKVSTH